MIGIGEAYDAEGLVVHDPLVEHAVLGGLDVAEDLAEHFVGGPAPR